MNNKEKKEKIYKIIAIVILIVTLMSELTLLGIKIRAIYLDKELEKINRVSMEASVTIKEFGNRLKNVYLTAPEEEVKKAIEELGYRQNMEVEIFLILLMEINTQLLMQNFQM